MNTFVSELVKGFRYLVDGKEWITDPAAMDFRSDGFGRKNSIVEVVRNI